VQMREAEEAEQTDPVLPDKHTEAVRRTLHSWVDTTLGYLGMLLGVILFIAAVIALRYIDSVAFYRGIYLVPAAIFAGGVIAFFMTVKPRWRGLYLIVALIAVVISIVGVAYDYPRYTHCLNNTNQNDIDADICTDDSWRVWVIPFTLLIATLLLFVAIILLIVRIVMGSKRFERYLRKRRDDQRRRRAEVAAAASGATPITSWFPAWNVPPTYATKRLRVGNRN
jgi:uncharacterized membrane protein (UPF0182 family)